ncbi:zinc finger protein 383-like [Vanessa tameamea]|uniref:Zinc finger protein 383-like n=1 Tax=Vanessa tameamea TaxID=334116 RepID=A0A8B8IP20_VANTA|nr:zinc finger protein 383-like [Vanessa tameamea]
MEELCTACLCSGRYLSYIAGTDLQQAYIQILNEISISEDMLSLCIRLCWECKAMLHRYIKFKRQAQYCYKELLDYNTTDLKHVLKKAPKIQMHSVHNISYPEFEVKVEIEDLNVKDEVTDDDDTHYEPETFVNDLVVDDDIKDKKVKKITKKKTKQKVKLKKKKIEVKKIIKVASDVEPECLESETENKKWFDNETDAFKCKDCGTVFKDEMELQSHIDSEHAVEEAVQKNGVRPRSKEQLPDKPQCVECGKIFSSRKTYRYHLNVLHKGQNRYPCPRCGKVYQWKSNLGRHMRSHKARDSGELHCRTCDKRFASVATYRQHLRVSRRHVAETDFTFMCNECGKRFVNKTRLRDHVDWEHLNKIKFRCQLCDKPFKCHTSLYVHMQNVHRNKEKKDNLCHVCGKSYQNAAKLKYHIVAMHTSETPYSCEQCSAAFGWYSSLYRHVREVHYKMKIQPKKTKKNKKTSAELPSPGPV